jgi:hypothetical protein
MWQGKIQGASQNFVDGACGAAAGYSAVMC